MDLLGESIDERYRVVSLLGSGGMADVYEVEHHQLGRRFALKLLRPELARDAALKARFEREARAVARLQSDNIVAIVDCGTSAQGAPYFVMERLQGQELRRLLQAESALPLQRALHIALDVCRALEVAHGAGLIHRDLKPENLFVERDSEGRERCKVLDFGVAKLTGDNPTLPGTLLGTARYMAPEQIGDGSAVAPTTDLFALGVILFECLAGEPPFSADTLERVLYKIVNDTPPSLVEARPELPRGIARLVGRLLAKSPAERPQSAREVAEALSVFTLQAHKKSADSTLASGETQLDSKPAVVVTSMPQAPRHAGWLAFATFGLGLVLGGTLGRSLAAPDTADPVAPVAARDHQPEPVTTPVPSTPAAVKAPVAEAPMPAHTTSNPPQPVAAAPAPATPESVRAVAHTSTSASATLAPSKPPLFFPQERQP
jgi:serine/threonine-protein kinase